MNNNVFSLGNTATYSNIASYTHSSAIMHPDLTIKKVPDKNEYILKINNSIDIHLSEKQIINLIINLERAL